MIHRYILYILLLCMSGVIATTTGVEYSWYLTTCGVVVAASWWYASMCSTSLVVWCSSACTTSTTTSTTTSCNMVCVMLCSGVVLVMYGVLVYAHTYMTFEEYI